MKKKSFFNQFFWKKNKYSDNSWNIYYLLNPNPFQKSAIFWKIDDFGLFWMLWKTNLTDFFLVGYRTAGQWTKLTRRPRRPKPELAQLKVWLVKEWVANSRPSFSQILDIFPHIRQNHSTFPVITTKIKQKKVISIKDLLLNFSTI